MKYLAKFNVISVSIFFQRVDKYDRLLTTIVTESERQTLYLL